MKWDWYNVRPFLIMGVTFGVAVILCWAFWVYYLYSPWTRDGRVRVEVVNIASQVSGVVQNLRVVDNQNVKKGDILFEIDNTDYQIALRESEAIVQAKGADKEIAYANSSRREKLGTLAVSTEEVNTTRSTALVAESAYQEALGSRDQARVNLDRTVIRSPVNGFVTNLTLREGDYARPGEIKMTLVDSDSFWVVGYFEETKLPNIHLNDSARIKLMGWSREVSGHVSSFARAIADSNSETNSEGLANVSPIFTWVRLAQRIPVRIQIDHVPDGVAIAAGQTCTIVLGAPIETTAAVGGKTP